MTTLGWLKHMEDPKFPYFEWVYKNLIHKFLVQDWYMIQAGYKDEDALNLWHQIFKILELDRKARRDLLLLAQAGVVGRTHANHILWMLMTGPALDPVYPDMNNLTTNLVYKFRRDFDRPPRQHLDLKWWWWTCLEFPYKKDLRWSPMETPQGYWELHTGPGLLPLPPPECWGPQRPAK